MTCLRAPFAPFPGAVALAVGLLGCTADVSDGTPRLAERLVACGLATPGELRLEGVLYAPDACYEDCYRRAACGDLQAALCRTSTDLLSACDAACAHRCSDGALVAVEAVCDGTTDCADGSDELECARFACPDGSSIPLQSRCNGSWNCRDGADEADCPPPSCEGLVPSWSCEYVCDNGQVLLGARRCDGTWSCADNSDERGCGQLTLRCGG